MNKTSIKVRQITDAAVITALYCVFLLISRLTGASLEYELFFIMPLPIALYSYKYSLKLGLIPLVATAILSVFICSTPFNSLVYVLPALIIGSVYGGWLIKTRINATLQVLMITGACLIMEILSSLVLASILGIEDIYAEIASLVSEITSLINVDAVILKAVLEGLIPSALIIISLIEGLLIYLIFFLIIQKSKLFKFSEKVPSFTFKYAPIWLSIVYLASIPFFILGMVFFNQENTFVHILCVIGINLFIILTIVFTYFGMKLVILYIQYVKKMWLFIFVLLFVLVPPLQLILASFGIIDSFMKLSQKIIDRISIQK